MKGNTLLSGLLLAKAKLRKDQPKEALAVLENANYGPLVRLEGDNPVAPSDANLPSEVYRTTLQVLVSLATAQGGESNMLDRAAAIIEKLRKAVEGQPNAEQKLVGIYYSLAKDIRQQLDDAQPARRGQLVDAFNLLLEKLIPLTNDNSTLRWIGQTFSELGQTLQPNLEAPAKGSLRSCTRTRWMHLPKRLPINRVIQKPSFDLSKRRCCVIWVDTKNRSMNSKRCCWPRT